MTEVEYNNLLMKCTESNELPDGYKVKNYITAPEKNLHVFSILCDEKIIVIGLPKPRSFHPSEQPQLESEIKEWEEYIKKGELFWKPMANPPGITDKKLKMMGVFILISGGESCGIRSEGRDSTLDLGIKSKTMAKDFGPER